MRLRIIAMLATAAVMMAACGDDDAATTTTAPPVTSAPQTAPPTTPPGAPESVTFTGADGVESIIEDTSRIVSLNGDLTEIVYALGLGDRLVAVDVTTIYPSEADHLPRVGFGQQLAAEPVLAFAPTVVIGDTQIQPTESISQLRGAGVPVVIIETVPTLDGVSVRIRQVAEALGVPEEGARIADQVAAEIADAQTLAAGADGTARVAFLYARGPQQIFLFGRGIVTQAMIEGANAIDTIAESGLNGIVPLTPEALVAAAPDVIIVPASGMGALGGMEGIGALPGVAETPAGREGNFLVYDDALILNFGPRTGEALRSLITDLYPELAG